MMRESPNIVYIFADEWRAQATGYNGDGNCETPVLDRLASESINVTHAVSGCPVCSPYRASLLTGQYPLTHGVYVVDAELHPESPSIAHAFNDGGYDTAYIGKWHVYGSPDGNYGRRDDLVPRRHQMGFSYWKGYECNHEYYDSYYYFNEDPTPRKWEGYDAFAQSRDAAKYIEDHADSEKPFFLMLSWGPPHFPLDAAPNEYRQRYEEREISLRPNVPPELREKATQEMRGYYAHIAALDDCLAIVLDALKANGLDENTILVFTSDHGDMRQCQGLPTKLHPWDESIRVPFLIRCPQWNGNSGRELSIPLDAPDIMPTLLGLCELPVPSSVEGRDWSAFLRGECEPDGTEAAVLSVIAEFGELKKNGMKAYRGLRTLRYTYVETIDGPYLLYDNEADPYQMSNLIGDEKYADVQMELFTRLHNRLAALGDEFLPGHVYLERDGFTHYQAVNLPCQRIWEDPWKDNSAHKRSRR